MAMPVSVHDGTQHPAGLAAAAVARRLLHLSLLLALTGFGLSLSLIGMGAGVLALAAAAVVALAAAAVRSYGWWKVVGSLSPAQRNGVLAQGAGGLTALSARPRL